MYTFQSSGHFNFTTEMDSSNSLVLNFAFPCGLCGFHIYKELWNPKLNEKLETIHKENNPHDRYAVAEDIEVDLQISVIKPLHAGWLVALYDYLTGAEGRCIFKGWEKAGVKEIVNSDKPLPPVDPFEEIYQA